MAIAPAVRHMLLCDEVLSDPATRKDTLVGLITSIAPGASPPHPFRLPRLCVYLQLTNGRGTGTVQIIIRFDGTGRSIAGTRQRQLAFPKQPLPVHSMVFRMLDCDFPQAGLYHVEFHVDGQAIAQEPLLLR